MKQIIDPIPREILKSELTDDLLLRKTNKAGNLVYVFDGSHSENLMKEVGRLREEAFRASGGGTGEEVDIDILDITPNAYKQLIVWDEENEEIIGGYRYIIPRSSNPELLSTAHYFNFSQKFLDDYLPYTAELGRSFVQLKYQQANVKSLFALDNLWDGLGSIAVNNPDIKYFFGKVTMYPCYNTEARDIVIHFLNKYFPDNENLMRSKFPANFGTDSEEIEAIFTGEDYAENYKILSRTVRDLGEVIPPLINSYMGLSSTMKVFETAMNDDFGGVEETGILVTLADVYEEKAKRHFTEAI